MLLIKTFVPKETFNPHSGKAQGECGVKKNTKTRKVLKDQKEIPENVTKQEHFRKHREVKQIKMTFHCHYLS